MKLAGTMGDMFDNTETDDVAVMNVNVGQSMSEATPAIDVDYAKQPSVKSTVPVINLSELAGKVETIEVPKKKTSPWLFVGAAAVGWFIFLRKKNDTQ